MGATEIRLATGDDAGVVQVLLQQLGYDMAAESVTRVLAPGATHDEIFVALIDAQVVACMSLIYFDYFPALEKVCRITAIVVEENYRRIGVGTQLVAFARQRAAEKACGLLEVTTALSRTGAQHYYENLGFDKTSYRYIQRLAPAVVKQP
jgi:N-acetylglutamate synthase-like GNAT family acetyltransferase